MPGPSSAAPNPQDDFRNHRRKVRIGQVLMGVGAVIAVVHLVAHLTGRPSGITDLVVGYPAAGVLFLVGGVLAGRADPAAR